jgi:hypothetical protein
MGIMDIFRSAPAPQPGPLTAKTTPQTDANGVVPPNTDINDPNKNNAPADGGNKSPMAEFHDLFKVPVVDPKNPPKRSALDFDIDPQKMMEAAGKVDFASAIPAELLAKIKAGGEDAVTANILAMNIIAQKTYGQAAVAAAAITKESMKAARAEFASEIPAMLKALNLDAGLRDKNPLFEDPAVAPIIEGLKANILEKHPNATPQQLQSMAENYVEKFANSFSKKPTAPKGKTGSRQAGEPDDDWETFLTPT